MNNYLFGFDGRIGRGGWWLGQGVLIFIFLMWVKFSAGNFMPATYEMGVQLDSNTQLRNSFAPNQNKNGFSISLLLMAFVFCWVWMAITAKRLHDIGKSGWWGVPGLAPSLLYAVVFFIIPQDQLPVGTIGVLSVANIIQSVAGLWFLRNCGSRAGDDFVNEYGPPPEVRSKEAVSALAMNATSSSDINNGLSKVDDAYFANYAKQMSQAQTSNLSSNPTPNFNQARPTFGKR